MAFEYKWCVYLQGHFYNDNSNDIHLIATPNIQPTDDIAALIYINDYENMLNN